KEPSHRYQSCAEALRDLDSLGVAHEHLSFIAAPAAPAGRGAAAPATRGPSPLAKTKPASAPPSTEPAPEKELWVLRYTDEHGRHAKKQVSTGRLKQLIERGEVDVVTATVMHPGEH